LPIDARHQPGRPGSRAVCAGFSWKATIQAPVVELEDAEVASFAAGAPGRTRHVTWPSLEVEVEHLPDVSIL
jgi:hypothetical protein